MIFKYRAVWQSSDGAAVSEDTLLVCCESVDYAEDMAREYAVSKFDERLIGLELVTSDPT